MEFNARQEKILEIFKTTDNNILLMGEAGTGKSVLLAEFVKHLEITNTEYWLTATTGTAADNVQGQTMHKSLGILVEPGNEPSFEKILSKIENIHLRDWQQVKVWILDEVSMLDGILFEILNKVAKKVRNNNRPFGGIRLVFCGDVLQLGPVKAKKHYFEADCYLPCFEDCEFLLTQNMRQKDDKEWLSILRRVRVGKPTEDDLKKFSSCAIDEKLIENDLDTLRIYCCNNDVDRINNQRLEQLIQEGKESQIYKPKITSTLPSSAIKHLKKPDLKLCVGAKVMHTRNLHPLINGSRGTVVSINPLVVDFEQKGKIQVEEAGVTMKIKHEGRSFSVNIKYIPLILAWALTVHKVQGSTIKTAFVDLGRVFCHSQIYVAISRLESIKGLGLLGFNPKRITCESKCVKYLERIREKMNVVAIKRAIENDDEENKSKKVC